MNTGVASRRYAKALLAYAKADGKEEQVYEEVKMLAASYADVPGLRRAIENPVLDAEKKLDLLREAAGGKDVSKELMMNWVIFQITELRKGFLKWQSNK